jgi:hypothetical protein
MLKALRKKAAETLIAQGPLGAVTNAAPLTGPVDGSGYQGPDPPTVPAVERASKAAKLNQSVDMELSAPAAPFG